MSHSSHSSKGAFHAQGFGRGRHAIWQTLNTFILPIALCLFGAIWGGHSLVEISRVNAIKEMPTEQFLHTYESSLPPKASQSRLVAISDHAMGLNPIAINIAKQATLKAAAYTKSCLSCETRLAYLEILAYGKLTPFGQSALLRSYEISPYGEADLMKWRLNVSNIYWNDLSEALQSYALMQITTLSETRSGQKWLKTFETNVEAIRSRISRLD